VAAACGWVRLKLPAVASGGLIAVAAFLSVFLFTVVVALWSRAGDLVDKAPSPALRSLALAFHGDLAGERRA
jgi:hypothetical protein